MTVIPAHGIGGRADLPLPGELVLQAGGFVVLASFLVVGLLWRRPRFETATTGVPVPAAVQWLADSAAVRVTLRASMLVLLGYLIVVALAGPDDTAVNPAPRALYVLAWVGVVPASLLLGPVWRVLNPLRALHGMLTAVLRLPKNGRYAAPAALGYWPAAAGLAVFGWLELVPDGRADPPVVGVFLLGYSLLVTSAAVLFGSSWFDRGDPFEVYSSLVAALSPVGRRPDHVVVLRNPLRGLAAVPPAAGLVAVLAVWWGSTVFDGLSGSTPWATASQAATRAIGPASVPTTALATTVLVTLMVLVAVSYRLATGALAGALVTTLIPIAVGYTLAHYTSLLLTEGPRGVAQLVTPMALRATGGGGPVAMAGVLPAPVVIAVIQVGAILVGHVVGVIAAHDRSAALLPEHRRLADQVPLVLLMIVYTMVGLYLLVIA